MDHKLKALLQDEMDREAELIMEEINSDPELKDVEAPEIIRERLFEQIRDYEERKANKKFTTEEKELIRLGRRYRKRNRWNKYVILVAALVGALGIGVTSMGGPKQVMEEFERAFGDREQTYINNDKERTGQMEVVTEAEAYEQIDELYGFYPVCFDYLPDVKFDGIEINDIIQTIQLTYKGKHSERLIYRILPNYRTGSVGTDLEDEAVGQYDREVSGVTVTVYEYVVEGSTIQKWKVTFEYQEVQYSLLLMGIEEKEVEKIIDNLYFS